MESPCRCQHNLYVFLHAGVSFKGAMNWFYCHIEKSTHTFLPLPVSKTSPSPWFIIIIIIARGASDPSDSVFLLSRSRCIPRGSNKTGLYKSLDKFNIRYLEQMKHAHDQKANWLTPICFNHKVALNAKRESYHFWQTKRQPLFPPLLILFKGVIKILTISIIWAGYMVATHGSFLYFYGLPSSLIDRVWLFNLTATPLRAGWLYDNGQLWSGIGWYFLVIQLDFPENREI